MEKEQRRYQSQPQQRWQVKTAEKTESDKQNCCPNCGAAVDKSARFCEECGTPMGGGNHCSHCGCEVPVGAVICPACGHPVTTNCTFCGSVMNANDHVCPDCGNSRSGITCPSCGTLNFRSFCRKCNQPLNPLARYAIEKARQNVHVKRAAKLFEEITMLEQQIAAMEQQAAQAANQKAQQTVQQTVQQTATGKTLDASVHMSDLSRRLMEEFAALGKSNNSNSKPQSIPKTESKPAETVTNEAPAVLSLPSQQAVNSQALSIPSEPSGSVAPPALERLRAQLQAKTAEFQKELEATIPDPGDPVEIQRNFACACQYEITSLVKVATTQRERVEWKCNLCGCHHSNPSECARPELGGTWIYRDVTTYTTHSVKSTINL